MITYLTVTFSTEGARPSEVADRLKAIGFRPTTGNYDFIYEWDRNARAEDALSLADRVQASLRGSQVLFKVETH